jgi:hypothetical protein
MENNGVTLSRSRLEELRQKYTEGVEHSSKVCVNLAASLGFPDLVLPKSGVNQSIRTFVFDHLKLPVAAVNKKSGNPSLGKAARAVYVDTLPERSKQQLFFQRYDNRSSQATALSYMEGYKRFWVPALPCSWCEGNHPGGPENCLDEHYFNDAMKKAQHDVWYRLHPNLNITGTHTLRWSSKNPNEQNISKKENFNLRQLFGPTPGREWWSLDANNIELRIPAYESGEPAMIEIFEKPEDPPYWGSYHLLIFSILHPDKYDHDDPEGLLKAKKKYAATWYQYVKNGNFADQYGAIMREDGNGTADRAYHLPGAQAIIAKKLTHKAKLNQHWIDFANRRGYVETMPDKTVDPKKGYPLWVERNDWGVRPTVPLNYHVQGTAMWWMQKAMCRVSEYIEKHNSTRPRDQHIYMIMQVHDELVFDLPFAPDLGNEPIIRDIQRLMSMGGDDLGLPTIVAIEYHPENWSKSIPLKTLV